MTRTTLTLELLAVLALACERQERAAPEQDNGEASVQSADPEWSNADLEHELDRIEKEIKSGPNAPDVAAPAGPQSREHEKGNPEPEPRKAADPRRKKSKNYRSKAGDKRIQSSGNGSS